MIAEIYARLECRTEVLPNTITAVFPLINPRPLRLV